MDGRAASVRWLWAVSAIDQTASVGTGSKQMEESLTIGGVRTTFTTEHRGDVGWL